MFSIFTYSSILLFGYLYYKYNKTPIYIKNKNIPGKLIKLNTGYTHYMLNDNNVTTNDLIILIGGFSNDMTIFNSLYDQLAYHKYNILKYDNIGRGFSEYKEEPHKLDLFVEQLYQLLFKLDLLENKKICLVGLSMGGLISARFAEIYPNFINKIIFIGCAGISEPPIPFYLKLPIISNVIGHIFCKFLLMRNLDYDWVNVSSEKCVRYYSYLLSRIRTEPNLIRSLLNTVLNFEFGNSKHVYQNISNHNRKILILWGEDDLTCPYKSGRYLNMIMNNSILYTVKNGRHCILNEFEVEVNQQIITFLNKN